MSQNYTYKVPISVFFLSFLGQQVGFTRSIRLIPVFIILHRLPVSLALIEAVFTQDALLHQVELLRIIGLIGFILGDDGVPVQVDPLQFVHPGDAEGDAGELVVGEADVPQLLQGGDGGGQVVQLVHPQAESQKLLQETHGTGEAGQTVVTQVQDQKVLETADRRRELLQLKSEQ